MILRVWDPISYIGQVTTREAAADSAAVPPVAGAPGAAPPSAAPGAAPTAAITLCPKSLSGLPGQSGLSGPLK